MSVIAGRLPVTSGYLDGVGTATLLTDPNGITIDSGSNIIFTEEFNNVIRKINTAGNFYNFDGFGLSIYSTDSCQA